MVAATNSRVFFSFFFWILVSLFQFQNVSSFTTKIIPITQTSSNSLRQQSNANHHHHHHRFASILSNDDHHHHLKGKGSIIRRLRSLASKESNSEKEQQQQKKQQRVGSSSSNTVNSKISQSSAKVTEKSASTVPSYKDLIIFTATTILIWISEPLLSLVDTAIVGMTSSPEAGVVQIAALGPATTLYDSAVYMTYFLAIAATNQLAPDIAKKDWRALRKTTSHLMGLGLLFGLIVTGVVFGFGKQMMISMAGHVTNSEIIPLATSYAMIRAAVAPFCVVDFVAQSFCLTTLDTVTPAIAVSVASIVNIIGDLILAPKYGIQGAAIATAMATVSSSLILANKVRKTTRQWKQYLDVEENQAAQSISTVVNGTVELRGMSGEKKVVAAAATAAAAGDESSKSKSLSLDNKLEASSKTKTSNHVPFFSLPDKKSLLTLFKLAGPIFFVMMSKIACYSVMTMRATNFGIVPLASHNIMMRIFFFFACFGDSLSQAAQTFFPQVKKVERGLLFRRLFYLSAAVGLGVSNVSATILGKFGSFLTHDASIIAWMSQYAPWVGMAVFLHTFLMLLEGFILAKRDLVFLVGMYVATMALHMGFVFSPISASFLGLWRAFSIFQGIRLVQLTGRVYERSRNEKKLEATIGGGGASAAL